MVGGIVPHDGVSCRDGSAGIRLDDRILGKDRSLLDEGSGHLTLERDVERTAKEIKVPLLADARPLAALHAITLDEGIDLMVVAMICDEVTPDAKDEVTDATLRVRARQAEALPELPVAWLGHVSWIHKMRISVVDCVRDLPDHVPHVDVGHEVPKEEGVRITDAERLGRAI